ncbi:MAG: phosphotransferase [Phycisphaerales bacterium]
MPPSRQQLSQREIDAVLAIYDIGRVHEISELAAGSVYSPKVIARTDRGKLLLKRRARGLDMPGLVAFSHEVMLGCLAAGVCVPPLLGTKADNNSMAQFEDHIYELFVFIDGEPFDRRRPEHAGQAGALLREVHSAMDGLRPTFEPALEPTVIDTGRLKALEDRRDALPKGLGEQLSRLMGYGDELARANTGRPALVHGDWHPGNMIFRGDEIVAICDFDNCRVGSRLREIAQAMVHISLVPPGPGQRAADAEPKPELDALRAFWSGYRDQSSSQPPPLPARLCLGLMPAVMIDEALATLPAMARGDGGGGVDGGISLLTAVGRKAAWLDEHQADLRALLEY